MSIISERKSALRGKGTFLGDHPKRKKRIVQGMQQTHFLPYNKILIFPFDKSAGSKHIFDDTFKRPDQ